MKYTVLALLLGSMSFVVLAKEQRIYQTDALGNIQYHKPSYVIQKNGRVIQTDSLGNKQYHKPQYRIQGDKLQPTDSLGNIQYQRPEK